jgi:hypothetical protein
MDVSAGVKVVCSCLSEIFEVFWSENFKGRDHSEDLGTDRRIILEWILGK